MLYYLFDYLNEIHIPGMRAFTYVTTRTGLAFIFSLIIATVIGGRIIHFLQRKQIGETIRDLGLDGENLKRNTPTMGGIIIIIAMLIPTLLFARIENIYIILMIVTTLWVGALGFCDDYIKVFRKNKKGVKGKYKIVAQIGLGVIVAITLLMSPAVVIKENTSQTSADGSVAISYSQQEERSTQTTMPFLKNNNWDYSKVADLFGVKTNKELLTFLVFVLACVLIVAGTSNAANLSDGLDGLTAGTSSIIGVVLGILAYTSSHLQFASYLNIMFIPGAEELVVFSGAFIGATMGFLWYNSHPAQVFMGDTGSLTLGAIIGVFAIVLRKELLLPILCGIYFVEALSVIIQTAYYRYSKGGRIFKMTPIHHHFQKVGDGSINAKIQYPRQKFHEVKIVSRIWLISLVLAAITLITLKLR